MYFQPFGLNTIQNLINRRTGSWGTPELGWSEGVGDLLGAGRNAQGGSNFTTTPTPANTVRPAESISPNVFGNVLGSTTSLPSWDYLDSLPVNKSSGGGGGSNPSGSYNFNNVLADANKVREDALRRASDSYNIGRGAYNEGIDTLNKRREQFQQNYDQTSGDILQGYEKNRGELNRSANEASTRTGNALRALGLGESAAVKATGRQNQENLRNLSSLQDSRVASDRANTANLNEQNIWADSQQSALDRYLQQLGSDKQTAETGADVNFNNILNSIQSSLASLQAARGDISGYTANPIAVNADQWASTVNNANLASLPTGGGGTADNSGVSIQNNPAILELLKKQYPGLSIN